jgi:hypothetical protein
MTKNKMTNAEAAAFWRVSVRTAQRMRRDRVNLDSRDSVAAWAASRQKTAPGLLRKLHEIRKHGAAPASIPTAAELSRAEIRPDDPD